jgi:hypothetical protein
LKAWGDSSAANLQFAAALKAGQGEQAATVMKAYVEGHQLKLKDGSTASIASLITKHNEGVAAGQAVDPDKWIQIDTTKMSPGQVLRALEVAHVENRYVPPRIWMDTAEDRMWFPSGYDPRPVEVQAGTAAVRTVVVRPGTTRRLVLSGPGPLRLYVHVPPAPVGARIFGVRVVSLRFSPAG